MKLLQQRNNAEQGVPILQFLRRNSAGSPAPPTNTPSHKMSHKSQNILGGRRGSSSSSSSAAAAAAIVTTAAVLGGRSKSNRRESLVMEDLTVARNSRNASGQRTSTSSSSLHSSMGSSFGESYDSILASLSAAPFQHSASGENVLDPVKEGVGGESSEEMNKKTTPQDTVDHQEAGATTTPTTHDTAPRSPKKGPFIDVSNNDGTSLISPNLRPKKKLLLRPPLQSPRTASKMILSPNEFEWRLALHHSSARPSSSIPPCMSRYLPVTKESQTLVLRHDTIQSSIVVDTTIHEAPAARRGLLVETITGELVATLEYSAAKERRILRDAKGNRCATILQSQKQDGKHRFKVCCEKPMTADHRRSNESGYYTWAEVKNSGGIGVKFAMKLRGGEYPSFATETFGPSPRGYLIHDQDSHSTGGNSKDTSSSCARLTYLRESRGLVVGPRVDLCLMICFTAIIDEMVHHRMR